MNFSSFLLLTLLTAIGATNTHAGDATDCVRGNASTSGLTGEQKVQLCQTATSGSPAECYSASTSLGLSNDERIQLCKGATSLAPIDCFRNDTASQGLTNKQRIKLCRTKRKRSVVILEK